MIGMNIQDTILSLFEAQVKKRPGDIAVICLDQSLTYGELNAQANQLAHYLRKIGVKPETQVAIGMERSNDLLITIIAILKAGGAYVPLDLSHPEKRLLATLNNDKTPILIIRSSLKKEKFSKYQGKLIILDKIEKEVAKEPIHNLLPVITAQHLAYVIYTSGSTGKPKGVLVEHKSVVNYSLWFAKYSHCHPNQRLDFSSNYVFDMTVSTSIVPLMLGLTVVICSDEIKRNIRAYLKFLELKKVNIIKITPSYFKELLHEVKSNFVALTHLQKIILGGEKLLTLDCASWLAIYPEHTLFNEYGPTEATVAVSQFEISSRNLSSLGTYVPIGKPGPNIDFYLLSKDHRPVPDGEIGELYIAGDCLARGYLNQPELTKKKFVKDPFSKDKTARLYKTGDLCLRLPDGSIEFSRRTDSQVKIRGFRIELGEIEKHLSAHPAIDEVAVLVREEEQKEKHLIAYYMLSEFNTEPSAKQMRQYLKTHLPDYMIPIAFVRIDTFPLTANGKLDYAALPIPQFTPSQHYLPPSTALEVSLAKIWSEELDIKLIGIEDDFFELGGHSLSAGRIIARINEKLKKDLSLDDFYYAPTIAKLVPVVNKARISSEKRTSLNGIAPDNSSLLPLGDFQFLLWISYLFEPKAKRLNNVARKRLQGRLDKNALAFAFKALLKKNKLLSYRILKLRAAQIYQKDLTVNLIEKNIKSLSFWEGESVLEASVNELINFHSWSKNTPLLLAKLFHLQDDLTEIQICIPHIISDDVSLEILLSDLSKFYLSYNKHSAIEQVEADTQYRDYILNEQYYWQTHIDRDISFWESYLKDTHLLTFPPEAVVKDMQAQDIAYSTYLEIPEQGLNNLQQFCAYNHVSINDGLCAVIALALFNCCANYHNGAENILMNIVRSTRDNQRYDETIGCFLRLYAIKFNINKESTLASLTKQIHQSVIITSPYQHCPSTVKLACINILRRQRKLVKSYLVRLFTSLYTKIFRTSVLNRKILNLCGRLISFKRKNNFMININVLSNFLPNAKSKEDLKLFGLKTKELKMYQYDLLKINNFFDVTFLRNNNPNIPYLVISANLKPDFRKLIAREAIRIISLAKRSGDE
jgi:amino acid adenylation domain-containing protein